MTNSENPEIEQLRNQLAALQGQVEALSIVLHVSIIMTEDVLKRHKDSIADLIGSYAAKHPNPHAVKVLHEWGGVLKRPA